MATYRIKQAAELLGVSDDTVRRWAESGRLTHDDRGLAPGRRRRASWPGSPRRSPRAVSDPSRGRSCSASARNRFVGLVTRVVRDTVMAQVEIQAGPHRVVSLMSREAADELAARARRPGHRRREVHQRRRRAPGEDHESDAALPSPSSLPWPSSSLAACGSDDDERGQRDDGRHDARLRRGLADRVVHRARQAVREGPPGHQGRSSTSARAPGLAEQIGRARRPTCSPPPARATWTRVVAGRGRRRTRRTSRRTAWRSPYRPDNPGKVAGARRPGQARTSRSRSARRRCPAARWPPRSSRTRGSP